MKKVLFLPRSLSTYKFVLNITHVRAQGMHKTEPIEETKIMYQMNIQIMPYPQQTACYMFQTARRKCLEPISSQFSRPCA